MTDEQIKKLAREYVEDKRSDVLMFFATPLPDSMEVLVREEQESVIKVIEWLSKAHCIVEKEKIRAIYNRKTIPTMEDVRNKMIEECLIDALFGKELFNGKEENNGM